ncbi:MAG: hypothetical protein ABI459_05495, partial [Deltaproteobacteria bacterium]
VPKAGPTPSSSHRIFAIRLIFGPIWCAVVAPPQHVALRCKFLHRKFFQRTLRKIAQIYGAFFCTHFRKYGAFSCTLTRFVVQFFATHFLRDRERKSHYPTAHDTPVRQLLVL